MIKESFKRKWVKALRSGEFKQGVSYLKKGNAYCCLGVACVLADVPIPWRLDGRFTDNFEPLNSATGLTEGQSENLAWRNDTGESFSEIADYIDANL